LLVFFATNLRKYPNFALLKNKAMINFNSKLLQKEQVQLTSDNRGFKYGDGIFETIKVVHNKVIFWEDHYFRLMASMRMLRMEIPMEFTLEFLEQEIMKTVRSLELTGMFRVRLNVFRKDGGLYTPETNGIDYLIEASGYQYETKESYEIDVFKDFYNYSGLLSTIKTNNRMLNTLASIYADENDLDNCVLVNERKGVVEVANGNIFIVKNGVVKTPALTEGCIKGIVRGKVIEILTKNKDFTVEETAISPFEIQKADEVFITNAIMGIQVVTKYKKKSFDTQIGSKLLANLKVLQIAGI
jgi:branched-chain amino acid aminotransferase